MLLSDEYLAGFFDAEGSVGVWGNGKNRLHVRVTLGHTYRPILDQIQEQWGGRIDEQKKIKPHHKARYFWRLSRRDEVLPFLEAIMPLLREKQERTINAWMVLAGLRDMEHGRLHHQRLMGALV